MKASLLDIIRYSILFSCLFISLGQFFFWFNYLVLPFILFGFKLKNVNDIPTRNLFALYILLAILVLITGLLSIDVYYPFKRFLEIISCIIYCYTIYININRSNDYIPLFKGIFIASLVLSLFLLYFYGDFSTFSLRLEDVEFGPGKNDSAMHLFTGFFSAIVLRHITGKHNTLYFLLGTFIFLIIVMTQSMKVIFASLLLELLMLYFFLRKKKTIAMFLTVAMIGYFYSIRYAIIEFFETGFLRVIYSRMLTLIGLEKYAPIQNMQVTEGRENLVSAALDIFFDNPICGVGLENTRLIIGTYSHNTYVELAAGSGIFASFLFIVLTVLCFYYLWRTPKNSCRNYFLLYIIMVAIVFANSLKIYSAHDAIIFLILSPYIIRLYSKYRINEN